MLKLIKTFFCIVCKLKLTVTYYLLISSFFHSPVPGGSDGPSGVLICSENYITYKNFGDQPDIRCPIPRRRVSLVHSLRPLKNEILCSVSKTAWMWVNLWVNKLFNHIELSPIQNNCSFNKWLYSCCPMLTNPNLPLSIVSLPNITEWSGWSRARHDICLLSHPQDQVHVLFPCTNGAGRHLQGDTWDRWRNGKWTRH